MSVAQEPADAAQARRFHLPHTHLESAFGNDWFGKKAEDFARFFGTPTFLIGQTIIVAIWILLNAIGWTQFDIYPFYSAQSRILHPGRLRGAIDPSGPDPSVRPRQGHEHRRRPASRRASSDQRDAPGANAQAVRDADRNDGAEHGAHRAG